MRTSTCRHCRKPIKQDESGDWLDDLANPKVCFNAISLRHAPAIQAITDRFGFEGRYDR